MNKLVTIAILVISPLLLIGCQSSTNLLSPTSLPIGDQNQAYPGAGTTSTYPIAEGEQKSPLMITPNPPSEAAEPVPGKASISGTLYSPTQKMVVPDTKFYLTPGSGNDHREVPPVFVGPQVDKGDIDLMSDSQGNFSVNNIPPGNYYLAVWAPLTWDVAQSSPDDSTPLLLEIKPDQKYPLGIVYVSWP